MTMFTFASRLIDSFRIDRYIERNFNFSNFSLENLRTIQPSTFVLLFITLLGFLIPLIVILPPLPLRFTEALVETHTLLTLRTSRTGNVPTHSLNDPTDKNTASDSSAVAKIARLCIYPVIPCRGIEIAKSKILRRGMQYDSIYAFTHKPADAPADAPAKLLFPGDCPNLGNLAIEIWVPDIIKTRGSLDKAPNEAFIIVSFPWVDGGWQGLLALFIAKVTKGLRAKPDKEGMIPIEFPTEREIKGIGYEYIKVDMGGKIVKMLDMVRELPSEISTFLGMKGKLGLVRVDKVLDDDSSTKGVRSLCLLPEKLEEVSKDFIIRRPNITITETLPNKGQGVKKINFSQGDALFSSDWFYNVSTYSDGALQLVPQPSKDTSKFPESWLEVGMGVVPE